MVIDVVRENNNVTSALVQYHDDTYWVKKESVPEKLLSEYLKQNEIIMEKEEELTNMFEKEKEILYDYNIEDNVEEEFKSHNKIIDDKVKEIINNNFEEVNISSGIKKKRGRGRPRKNFDNNVKVDENFSRAKTVTRKVTKKRKKKGKPLKK